MSRTPWRVEFMKQVFPWLMSPGGKLASFSSSSRFFLSMYISCGVCLLLCLIIGGIRIARSYREVGIVVHCAGWAEGYV